MAVSRKPGKTGPAVRRTSGKKRAGKRKAKPAPAHRAVVRMYRQGLGDCFLVSLPRSGGARDAHIMIDCGVLLATRNAAEKLNAVVEDIATVTGGEVDLLVVTHEHWDHLSGFLQAREALDRIKFADVWMSWAENPDDQQAKALEARRSQMIATLRVAEARLGLAGAPESEAVGGLLSFFGAAGRSTRDALNAARARAPDGRPRYVEPDEAPSVLSGTSARIFVLGPPRDEAFLLRSSPSKSNPETYGFGMAGFPLDEVARCLEDDEPDRPFAARWCIPMEIARSQPFFRRLTEGRDEAWRRIDLAWLEGAVDLALKLDRDTNNSSLALAIELPGGDVMLFAADAQVGNWLSWQGLAWGTDGERVTADDLLSRTVLYKVGHHGSHNATLRALGLEKMTRLRTALVPVDEEVARRQGWTQMPLPSLMERLAEVTGGRILRSDAPAPPDAADITETPLCFEVRLA
jgi:hypothetical protein